MLLAVVHFAVPFLLLLSRQTKRQPARLFCVALLLLVMQLVEYSITYSNTYVMTTAVGVFITGFSSILTGLNFIRGLKWRARIIAAVQRPAYSGPAFA